MRQAQIKFGLALADDIRRLRKSNALPGDLFRVGSSVEAVMEMERRLRDREIAKSNGTEGLISPFGQMSSGDKERLEAYWLERSLMRQ